MNEKYSQEKQLKAGNGMAVLILGILLVLVSIALIIVGAILLETGTTVAGTILLVVGIVLVCSCWIPFLGLKILKPQEALVLTLFGKYIGTLRGEGFFFVNPFVVAVNPTVESALTVMLEEQSTANAAHKRQGAQKQFPAKKIISLKKMTLNNNRQKVNDELGNPVEIGIVVIWRVVNTAKAVFNVDNYKDFLSIQCDSSLRNIARLYPYDVAPGGEEMTLRGSSQEVAEKLKAEIQSRVEIAGLEIMEARITHLAYAPEIAAVMLQRQQASAIIDARKMIVEGAVGMVEMALEKLSQNGVVNLDEERKAAMVSNLLVVLCGNRDAQPIVNSGSIY
ncbi:SPFH domain-containing protein [Parasporobacterium paucivorans]|uniref:SPFH domain / Band 7 family protein n=1 Tax=Parasporobacterium paucivorans DSM 15970 TaxID=1122934 RepID=A0A1M6G1B7_9FIRM|nr:SPFH domain-containing protein [Parasporobacterium paucivorans]SHJ03746.1 SPFH domain / Band 7 family protein [Parasporobacterium paucivorans DSM 15970]